jgi:carbon monoxide dehydrogenase subunit G
MVVHRERVVGAAPAEVWRIVSDPTRLAAWWPGVSRVEEASREAWTTVLVSPTGKTVRADYSLVEVDEPERVLWRHEVEESPFERLLTESTTEIALAADEGGGTRVRVTLDQRPRGWARFSPFQLRAAARRQAEGALDGLSELLGDGS